MIFFKTPSKLDFCLCNSSKGSVASSACFSNWSKVSLKMNQSFAFVFVFLNCGLQESEKQKCSRDKVKFTKKLNHRKGRS